MDSPPLRPLARVPVDAAGLTRCRLLLAACGIHAPQYRYPPDRLQAVQGGIAIGAWRAVIAHW